MLSKKRRGKYAQSSRCVPRGTPLLTHEIHRLPGLVVRRGRARHVDTAARRYPLPLQLIPAGSQFENHRARLRLQARYLLNDRIALTVFPKTDADFSAAVYLNERVRAVLLKSFISTASDIGLTSGKCVSNGKAQEI